MAGQILSPLGVVIEGGTRGHILSPQATRPATSRSWTARLHLSGVRSSRLTITAASGIPAYLHPPVRSTFRRVCTQSPRGRDPLSQSRLRGHGGTGRDRGHGLRSTAGRVRVCRARTGRHAPRVSA